MPYYKEKNLLFIHIPKTGGRVIENQIKKITKETLYSRWKSELLDPPYDKISFHHQYYSTLYKFQNKIDVNFDNVKIFSVVRNPYNRIISDLFFLKLIKKDFTREQIYEVIKNNYLYRNDLDNHNEPQYKFLVDENCKLVQNIKLFRTETLNQLGDELNNFLGFKINIKRNHVNKDYSVYLNKNSISLINNFYKKDFELFNYDLKSE